MQFDNQTNEIKFKITTNKYQKHPDSLAHAGTVTFKEKTIIEPDVKYIFGLWNRSNEEL